MRHFLFEDREYQYRPSYKRGRKSRDPVAVLAGFLCARSKGGHAPRAARSKKDYRQRCAVKMQYSGSTEAHKKQLEYLAREGTAIDGSAAELFGTEPRLYEEKMAGRNFRIFLSPESDKVDVKELAEKFVEKLEKQTGYGLYWQGACHYNTAHPHAHLLINGTDKSGREIVIPPDIVKTFMREASRDLCTSQIGKRTQQDLDREREQELATHRYTKLDGRIGCLCYGTNTVSLKGPIHDRERILARLETLRKLKLCSYAGGNYVFRENWQEDLKANSRYNAFLQARETLQYTDPSLMKLYSGEQGYVTGKVTKVYRTDGDASDSHAVVLEALDGSAYFIPLLKKPELRDGESRSPLREGELVTVSAYRTQKGRLTPAFFRKDTRGAQKDIKKNGYHGALAEEIAKTKTGFYYAARAE